MLDRLLLRWFTYCHGVGEKNQCMVYRCEKCRRLVTHRRIALGGCVCSSNRVSPTNPSFIEKIRLLAFPRSI